MRMNLKRDLHAVVHKFDGQRSERFRKLQREKMGEQITDRAPCDEMEKGDGLAMLIAAMITIVPICLAVMAVLALAGYFFIVR